MRITEDLRLQWGRGFTAALRVEVDNAVHAHGVEAIRGGRLLYTRIVRRKIKNRWVYYAQAVCDGLPLVRYEIGDGVVGLDLGPSNVAVVTDNTACLERFCTIETPPREPGADPEIADLDTNQAEVRRLQRRLDRQHRAGSPECFDDQGRHRPGPCRWQRSARARRTVVMLADAQRRKAAHRKSLHGNLANRVLGEGRHIHVERLSKKAWQKRYGRSVGHRAPAMFEVLLTRKAVSAGGSAVPIDATRACLSQTCICGAVKKKKLSERTHRCSCGVVTQRDVFSAFLARHTQADGATDLDAARNEWCQRQDLGVGCRPVRPNPRVPRAAKLNGTAGNRQSESS